MIINQTDSETLTEQLVILRDIEKLHHNQLAARAIRLRIMAINLTLRDRKETA